MSIVEAAGAVEALQASSAGPTPWLRDLIGFEDGVAGPVSGAALAAVLTSILAVMMVFVYAGTAPLRGRAPYSLSYVPVYPPS